MPYNLTKQKYILEIFDKPVFNPNCELLEHKTFHSMDEVARSFGIEHDTVHRLIDGYYSKPKQKIHKKTYYLRCMRLSLIDSNVSAS
jgi:hypothetical protein